MTISIQRTCVAAVMLYLAAAAIAAPINISFTGDGLFGAGTGKVNRDGNGSAVEADRPGQLVTSTAANVGSILTIQSNGVAGPGDAVNPLLMTVTARSHTSVDPTNAPAGYDYMGGVIALSSHNYTKDESGKEGMGVRAFGIDLDPASARYGMRYENAAYVPVNTHGFQMEGSGDVSGGYPWIEKVGGKHDPDIPHETIDWDTFLANSKGPIPNNTPPHVNEDVSFDINDGQMALAANSVIVILTNINAGSDEMDLSIDLTINLVGGGVIQRTYNYLSDAPNAFSLVPNPGDPGKMYDKMVQFNFGQIRIGDDDADDDSGDALMLSSTDFIDSFTIGARLDLADDPKTTDEHFLIGGISADVAPVPEPATMSILALGGAAMLKARRRR